MTVQIATVGIPGRTLASAKLTAAQTTTSTVAEDFSPACAITFTLPYACKVLLQVLGDCMEHSLATGMCVISITDDSNVQVMLGRGISATNAAKVPISVGIELDLAAGTYTYKLRKLLVTAGTVTYRAAATGPLIFRATLEV